MDEMSRQPDAEPPPSGTVLVVDDEPQLVEMYAAMLEDVHTVRTATTGEAALEQFSSDVDVLLLDRRMPETTGDELLDVVRTEGYDYQVAMVTAVDPKGEVAELSVDAYLVKPVQRDELRAAVGELLLRSQYSADVQELLRVTSKLVALEAEYDDAALADHEEYQTLAERKSRLERESRTREDELVERVGASILFRDVVGDARN